MRNLLSRILKTSIYSLVFLTPLFWLPFSFEFFEFSKQYLLFFLVSLALFSWLAKMILAGEIKFKKTPLDIFVLGFLFVAILSAIFSVDRISSIFGFYGRFSDGLASLLSLGALYFLITNNTGKKDQNLMTADGFLKVFLWSSFLVVLTAYFSIFGVWAELAKFLSLPAVMLNPIFNSVSGSLEGLAIFLAVLTVFLSSLILRSKNFFLGALLAVIAGLLIIIDFLGAWLVLLSSLIIFLGFSLWKRIFKEKVNHLLLPIFLIVLAAFGILGNFFNLQSSLLSSQLPKEKVLESGVSLKTSFGSATDSIKSGFLGSGIGTYHYDFTKEKPLSFNQSPYWQIRFDRPNSNILEILGTVGFLGLLSFLSLIAITFLVFYLSGALEQKSVLLPFMTMFLGLAAGQFFYYQNTTLTFLFWLVLGILAVSFNKSPKEKIFSFKDFPELNLVFTTVLIIVGLGLGASYYFVARFYMADKNFSTAQKMEENQDKIKLLEKTVQLNPYQPQYWIDLSRAYLRDLVSEARAAQAVAAAKKAVDLGPGQVASFETLAMAYREVIPVVPNAKEWTEKSFQEAIILEPTNPVLRTELARVFLIDNPEKAKEELQKAKNLKPDYWGALLQEAAILEGEGKKDKAVKVLERLVLDYPYNVDFRFQLGRLYFNNNQTDDAIAHFKIILQLAPNRQNALYALAAAYQKKGDLTEAKKYFERVLELNPDNEDVKQKLKELK